MDLYGNMLGGMPIIILPPIKKQARTHKKKRINKTVKTIITNDTIKSNNDLSENLYSVDIFESIAFAFLKILVTGL